MVAIWVAYLAGWSALRPVATGTSTTSRSRPAWSSVLLWSAVAVPSLVQLTGAPQLLAWGQRDPGAVTGGQWWRLLTAIGLQDGGWPGAVFNLATLAVTLLLVGRVWHPPLTITVFLVGGVAANLLTVLTSGPAGAGNSMATLCLLAAATVTVRGAAGTPGWVRWAPVLLHCLAAVALLLVGDQHGLAVGLGLVAGGALASTRCARVEG